MTGNGKSLVKRLVRTGARIKASKLTPIRDNLAYSA